MAIPLRKPLPAVRKKCFVDSYVRENPVKGLAIHCHTTYKSKHRFLVGHGGSHSCHPAEVSVEAFNPVGGVYHGLYLGSIIEICQRCLIVSVIAKQLYGRVILIPSVSDLLV